MEQWEYKIVDTDGTLGYAQLDAYGLEGWELIQIIKENGFRVYTYYFKRKLNNQ